MDPTTTQAERGKTVLVTVQNQMVQRSYGIRHFQRNTISVPYYNSAAPFGNCELTATQPPSFSPSSTMVFPNLMMMMADRPLDELHHCWQLAMDYVEQHAQSREQLREAKKMLKQQLREFTTGEPASPCSRCAFSLAILI